MDLSQQNAADMNMKFWQFQVQAQELITLESFLHYILGNHLPYKNCDYPETTLLEGSPKWPYDGESRFQSTVLSEFIGSSQPEH
jgi:hypothetical protein